MKFLCPNCKAKYQISDEKIAGRTLKMDCRRCNHPIVIRGNKRPSQSSASISSPSRRPGSSHVGPSPARSSRSALGSDFRRQASAAPAPQKQPTALDQWHIAINDVPVGPMKRDEVDKKMASRAITGESLCWREGFDDWRPVKKVPELAAMLRRHQSRPAAPPPPKPAFPSPSRPLNRGPVRPARPPAGRLPSSPRTGAQSAAARAVPAAPPPSNVVPIGGRLGASAAPAFDDIPHNDEFEDEEPTRVGTSIEFDELERQMKAEEDRASGAMAKAAEAAPVPAPPAGLLAPEEDAFDPFASQAGQPAPAAAPAAPVPPPDQPDPFAAPPAALAAPAVPAEAQEVPERRRRAIPLGAWIAIAGAMAFGVALAVMVGTHLLTQPTEVTTATPTPPEPQATDTTPPAPELEVPEETPEQPEETPEETPEATDEGGGQTPTAPRNGTGRRGRTGGSTTTTTGGGRGASTTGSARPSPNLTEAQRAALARAGEADEGGGPANLGPARDVLGEGGGSNSARSELTGDQIRSVVTRNRSGVQRCYETEARRAGGAPTVRINAQVTIGASGTVQRVNAQGGSFGNLGTCIERVVRRWRFPRSSGTTSTSIPFVFSGQD